MGVALPLIFLATALSVALSVAAGAGAGPGITIGSLAGMFLFAVLEIVRRLLLVRRGTDNSGLVAMFRGMIWTVVVGAPLVALFAGAGVLSGCYGRGCAPFDRGAMIFMVGLCVVAMLMLMLGWSLLRRATWLQVR